MAPRFSAPFGPSGKMNKNSNFWAMMCEQSTGLEGLFQIQIFSRAGNRRDTKDESWWCWWPEHLLGRRESRWIPPYRHFNRGGRLTWLGTRLCTTSSTCELPSSFGGMIVSKVSSATLQHFAKNSALRLEGHVKKWQRVPARGKFWGLQSTLQMLEM